MSTVATMKSATPLVPMAITVSLRASDSPRNQEGVTAVIVTPLQGLGHADQLGAEAQAGHAVADRREVSHNAPAASRSTGAMVVVRARRFLISAQSLYRSIRPASGAHRRLSDTAAG